MASIAQQQSMLTLILVAGVGALVLYIFAAIMTAYSTISTDHRDQPGVTVGMSLLILVTLGELLLISNRMSEAARRSFSAVYSSDRRRDVLGYKLVADGEEWYVQSYRTYDSGDRRG
ncbi:MAG: hypothetical protein OHK93_000709 [Ramalina farinacea]|uniref:Uncharacterized protein n=1 Tax=Ramalina farinacea TaxID=258253 RepID=A0AA43QFF4_9LECA|nr:hypothetical protein [Ramalina farinacea]